MLLGQALWLRNIICCRNKSKRNRTNHAMNSFCNVFSVTTPDTSSFSKVSLKTNNKALASALEIQKEKSKQLEMANVYLLKEVRAFHLQLATRRHKERKMVS